MLTVNVQHMSDHLTCQYTCGAESQFQQLRIQAKLLLGDNKSHCRS